MIKLWNFSITREKDDTFCMRTKPDICGMHEIETCAGKIYSRMTFSNFNSEKFFIISMSAPKEILRYIIILKMDRKLTTLSRI